MGGFIMIKLTGIVIAKNEEEMIGECLDSLAFCDQIIVVDNASSDGTKKIAKQKGAKVISTEINSFSELRNLGLAKARSEYVLYIDADERVSDALYNEILSIVYKNDKKISAYRIPRKNYYFGDHPWPYIEKLERLFRKKSLKGWLGVLHETPQVIGEVGELESPILHYTHRNLEEMVNKTNVWSDVEARLRFEQHHPKMTWWRFPRVMFTAFWDSFVKQKGFQAGTIGLLESVYQAYSMFITYAKLWELQEIKQ
ncbi:MAG: LPS biosynthesis protein [Patescibacteria group bacterium]|nr:MAG: LPS biosynthesis protein [Patescibacteria group bacterium]